MSGGDEATIMVKAQYAYTTSEPNELSFTEGALIKVSPRLIFSFSFLFFSPNLIYLFPPPQVTYQDDSGWWEGELNGRVGVFPSNHVRPAAAPP